MLAKRVPSVLPPMTLEEALETTRIHSISGVLDVHQSLVATRPYRAPHHTISDAGLLGGGTNPMPGEVSLAHHGVLFLDELPEFNRNVLEVLRQPLEDGQVTISRAAATVTFPCRFMLVAAMNPCPCGYQGDPRKECQCTPNQVQRYRNRISGPRLSECAQAMLKMAITDLNFSARAYDRILKVARTIADLDGAPETVEEPHIAEAIQYRSLDREAWG